MPNRKKSEESHLSILEAVEALSTIADMEFPKDIDQATQEEINQQNNLLENKIGKWVEIPDEEHSVKLITETFQVVHSYLRTFYKNNYRKVNRPKVIEGVKTIMVLVGEAAKKLDHFTTLFQNTKSKSVKNLKEYKQLQQFYLTRIARKIDEGVLGRWVFELTRGVIENKQETAPLKLIPKTSPEANHIFIDMESVKSDEEYELFLLRKEDGSRFFNPKLIRNIKLVADFGEGITEGRETYDPLDELILWHDHTVQKAAADILQSLGNVLDRFFHEARQVTQRELVGELYKAIIALIMSSNPAHLIINAPHKCCSEYFVDFHYFLRRALNSREYQRMLLYPPKKSSGLSQAIIDISNRLCLAFFTQVKAYDVLRTSLSKLIEKGEKNHSPEHKAASRKSRTFWSRLASEYAALKKLLKGHPNGPLVKVLDYLQNGGFHLFDPIAQSNMPNLLYSIYLKDQKLTKIHLPSPTCQENIDKAHINPEFKTFLHSYSSNQNQRCHLIFNLQDRTSWREHSRASALEDLSKQETYRFNLSVVTLAKDTEFYNQIAPYNQDNHADVFFEHFKENLMDESCGFYFPPKLKEKLSDQFFDQALKKIHQMFFGGMNVLTLNNRLDFIEIFYLFLELKILDIEKPDTFSFTCKDGIDKGGCAGTGLYLFMKIANGEEIGDGEFQRLSLNLYAPALLNRERIPLAPRFDRMVSAIRRIEGVKEELGAKEFEEKLQKEFKELFKNPVLKAIASLHKI